MSIIKVKNLSTGEAIMYTRDQLDLAREVAAQLSIYTRQTWVIIRGGKIEEEE